MGINLQIKILSKVGEVISSITCESGRVTVLSAASPVELGLYKRALSGNSAGANVLVTVAERPYEPREHILIGFDTNPLGESESVADYLRNSGVPSSGIRPLLMSFDIAAKNNISVSALTPAEKRSLFIIAACYSQAKAVIINDPFEPVVDQFKERLAEALLEFAKTSKYPVIVTGLSYRPECWIENPHIERIQVGEALQKTVGFSADTQDINEILRQVRKSEKVGAQSTLSSGAATNKSPPPAPISKNTKQIGTFEIIRAAIIIFIISALTIMYVQTLHNHRAMLPLPAATPTAAAVSTTPHSLPTTNPVSTPEVEPTATATPTAVSKTIPVRIKGEPSLAEMLATIPTAIPDGPETDDSAPANTQDNREPERNMRDTAEDDKAREEVRKRFLEAIRKMNSKTPEDGDQVPY